MQRLMLIPTHILQLTDPLSNAYDLFLMSLFKPDHELRTQAKELGCYNEMMVLRNAVIEQLTEDYKRVTKTIQS